MDDLDKRMEQDIQDLVLTAPRVTPDKIEALMEDVEYHVQVIGTTTLVTSEYKGFTLATEKTACIDPKNFNAELGEKYAKERCVRATEDQLWMLEGWRLKMNNQPV